VSLSDIVSAARLEVFTELALVLGVAAMLGVAASIFRRSNRETFERARFMPLDDDSSVSPRGDGGEGRNERRMTS
jgi:cbb3-type cytochrome oxidase subunit 3